MGEQSVRSVLLHGQLPGALVNPRFVRILPPPPLGVHGLLTFAPQNHLRQLFFRVHLVSAFPKWEWPCSLAVCSSSRGPGLPAVIPSSPLVSPRTHWSGNTTKSVRFANPGVRLALSGKLP